MRVLAVCTEEDVTLICLSLSNVEINKMQGRWGTFISPFQHALIDKKSHEVPLFALGTSKKIINPLQGRIYIGASGSMAPGPEVPGGPFESLGNLFH